MKGWKNHSKPEVVQEYRKKLLEERGYVVIEGDTLADTIWLWWNEIGHRTGLSSGTLSSSCQLADYLRTVFTFRHKLGPSLCGLCNLEVDDYYMVKDGVWLSVMPTKKGYLHLACLEEKLSRKLTLEDFTDARVNATVRFAYQMGKR